MSSPDVFLPLTCPQMVSTGCPNVFFLMARFMSSNSADAGSSIFAATVVFAFFRTGSAVSTGWPDAATSVFAGVSGLGFFSAGLGAPDDGVSGFMIIGESVFSSVVSFTSAGLSDDGAVVLATFFGFALVG